MWKKPIGSMNQNDAIAAIVKSVPEEKRLIPALWGITVIKVPILTIVAMAFGAWLR